MKLTKRRNPQQMHTCSYTLISVIQAFVVTALVTVRTGAQPVLTDAAAETANLSGEPDYQAVHTLADLTNTDLSVMNPAWIRKERRANLRALSSPTALTRVLALRNVIYLAQKNPGGDDLSGAIPELLRIYQTSPVEAERIMAVAALHAIGNERSMDELHASVSSEKSPRVRKHTLLALAEYYEKRGTWK